MKISATTMTKLGANASNHALTMIREHGVEGAKAIAAELKLHRCPECKTPRTDDDYFANHCQKCGDLGLSF